MVYHANMPILFRPPYTHFYIVKLGCIWVWIIFFFLLLLNIDGDWGGSNEYPQSMFWVKLRKKIAIFNMKIEFFAAIKIAI